MNTVTLYHGTFASLVPSIMERGLEPRGDRPSHDEYPQSPSMPDFVYLTRNYGLALEHACRISERTADGADVAVLELDMSALKRRLIYPDEDYLKEEWNSDFTDWTLKEQLKYMESHKGDWRESLKMMKAIAYKGVIEPGSLRECRVPRWLEQEKRRMFFRRAS